MIATEIVWLSTEQHDAMLRRAQYRGYSTIRDYVRMLADAELEADSLDAAAELDAMYDSIHVAYTKKRGRSK